MPKGPEPFHPRNIWGKQYHFNCNTYQTCFRKANFLTESINQRIGCRDSWNWVSDLDRVIVVSHQDCIDLYGDNDYLKNREKSIIKVYGTGRLENNTSVFVPLHNKGVTPVTMITTVYLPRHLIATKFSCKFFDPAWNTIFCARFPLNKLDSQREETLGRKFWILGKSLRSRESSMLLRICV